MTSSQVSHHNSRIKTRSILLLGLAATVLLGKPLSAVELPPEMPLWKTESPEHPIRLEVEEQVRTHKARPNSPTGQNRAFSSVSSPTYSIHRPEETNGVGLVICPGGGFRDIWIDREGHDLAIWLHRLFPATVPREIPRLGREPWTLAAYQRRESVGCASRSYSNSWAGRLIPRPSPCPQSGKEPQAFKPYAKRTGSPPPALDARTALRTQVKTAFVANATG